MLREHAEREVHDAYAKAVGRAVKETGLPETAFPPACPYTVDQLLAADLLTDAGA